eukprot:Plantae.Rhodophyta-Hildenbrandia_rubra.ctg4963.p2 GENE.Plantae.Rhodophyta-Hildenbrandia_rubra.ctg4963~~Plantae.Rhodophyta-Hildenbrandia_rubra.ctg4963.p2  ORF type:complete len:731 (-),score=105.95 Plantae.Rhodophyta-Hildenbrandia_rubra.ctg4963:1346-3538(-)
MLPIIYSAQDMQVVAWHFILKRHPHKQTSDVIDCSQKLRSHAQSCVELGLVGSEEDRSPYNMSGDRHLDLASGSGIAERVVIIEWAKELNRWHGLIGMHSKCTEKLMSQAWSACSDTFEKIERSISTSSDAQNDEFFEDAEAFLGDLQVEGIYEGAEIFQGASDIGCKELGGEDDESLNGELSEASIVTLDQWLCDAERRVIAMPKILHEEAKMLKTEQWLLWLGVVCGQHMAQSKDRRQMLRLIVGMAEAGKTCLLRVIMATLNKMGEKCLPTAPAGIAAQKIDGRAIHAHHGINDPGGGCCSHSKSWKVRKDGRDSKALIVDEISMAGAYDGQAQEKELRDNDMHGSWQHRHLPHGGRSVLFFGDLAQLPAAQQRQLWARGSERIWGLFEDNARELTEIMRAEDYEHCELLRLARFYKGADEEKEGISSALQKRLIVKGAHEPSAGAAWLTASFKRAQERNLAIMPSLGSAEGIYGDLRVAEADDSFIIPCSARGRNRAPVEGDREEHCKSLLDENHAQARKLLLREGMQAIIAKNVGRKSGLSLVNGEAGKLLKASLNSKGQPSALSVKLRKGIARVFKISGRVKKRRGRHDGSIHLRGADGIYRFACLDRQQFPLLPLRGITAHKGQGDTMGEAVVDFNDQDVKFQPGMAYVALSRCKKLKDLRVTKADPWEQIAPSWDAEKSLEKRLEKSKDGWNQLLEHVWANRLTLAPEERLDEVTERIKAKH